MRACLITLGCPKNLADSEDLAGCLHASGWTIVDDVDTADLLLLNTCAFIAPAVEESVEALIEAIEWKRSRQGRRLILAGCLPGRYEWRPEGEMADIDCVIGPADRAGLLDFLGGGSCGTGPRALDSRVSRYLRLAEGCSNDCSYCTIPLIRGPFRPIPLDVILETAHRLVEQGASEIGLVAQDPAAWRDAGLDLTGLVELLSGSYPYVWWRAYYLHPGHFPFDLLDLMLERSNVAPYVDVPVQHFDRSILEEMGRGYGPETLERIADATDSMRIPVAVRASVIAGFPGEGEGAFEGLTDFLQGWGSLRHVPCFAYSPEEGTRQWQRSGSRTVEDGIVAGRMSDMGAVADRAYENWSALLTGSVIEVLMDGPLTGHSVYDAPLVDGVCRFDECAGREGDFVRARVKRCEGADILVERLLPTGRDGN